METESLYRRIDPLFVHPASRLHARQYLHGLLSPLEKKNAWTIGELTDENPKKLQRFLNLATWDADELLSINRRYAMEHFADPEAILAADPAGFAKKGRKSAGVQRQYSGTPGRVDNCQIGTFLAYVTPSRDRILIDRELYVPQSWIDDGPRCAEAGIPAGHARRGCRRSARRPVREDLFRRTGPGDPRPRLRVARPGAAGRMTPPPHPRVARPRPAGRQFRK